MLNKGTVLHRAAASHTAECMKLPTQGITASSAAIKTTASFQCCWPGEWYRLRLRSTALSHTRLLPGAGANPLPSREKITTEGRPWTLPHMITTFLTRSFHDAYCRTCPRGRNQCKEKGATRCYVQYLWDTLEQQAMHTWAPHGTHAQWERLACPQLLSVNLCLLDPDLQAHSDRASWYFTRSTRCILF